MQILNARYDDGIVTFKQKPKTNHSKIIVTFLDDKENDLENEFFIKPLTKKEKISFEEFQKRKDTISYSLKGCLKGLDISNWKDERSEYLLEKQFC